MCLSSSEVHVSKEIDKDDLISRREFTVESVMALLAGVTITVSGCGDDDGPSTSPTPTTATDVTGTVSANHGHVAVVTAAQITAANTVMLPIQGTATHPHTVELTGAELRLIGARTQVTKTSTNDNGHTHTVTFN
jgi:hypothetical protein